MNPEGPTPQQGTRLARVDRRRRRVILTAVLVGLVGLLVRLPGLQQGANGDELLNVLAARAWEERGELAIVEGASPYERGAAITRLQAQFVAWGDDDLVAARLVSLGFGIIVIVGAALWGGAAGGAVAGGITGMFVAIDPLLVQLHQSARFYAPLQLFFLLGAALTAALLATRNVRLKALLGAGAVTSFAIAVNLQIVTLIGVAFVGAFVILWYLPTMWRWFLRGRMARRLMIGAALALSGGLAIALVLGTGLLERLIQLATYTDYWAEGNADNFRFYYVFLHDQFASVMVLLPLLALLAARRDRLHGSFTFFVFLGGVITASFLAWKAPRYISHLLPIFYVGVGLGVAVGWDLLKEHVPRIAGQAFSTRARWVPAAFTLAVLGALLLGNRALLLTGRLMTRDPELHYPLMGETTPTVSWERALPTLLPLADSAATIVSNRPSKALYYLGRVDYSLQYNAIERLAPAEASLGTTYDARYNLRITTDPAVLREATCRGNLLVVNNRVAERGAASEVVTILTFLQEEGERIELPGRYGLNAYWFPQRTNCDGIVEESA